MLKWLNRRASLLEWIFVRGIIVFNVYFLAVDLIVRAIYRIFESEPVSTSYFDSIGATNFTEWILTRVAIGAIGGVIGWTIQSRTDAVRKISK